MLNKVLLQGRLVADPELRHTQSNIPVASFRIAVERDYKSQNGDREADFINIAAWRGTAELVSRYFSKGRMIIVDGRLQVRDYTDRDGNRRYATEVIASNVYFGDSKKNGTTDNARQEPKDNNVPPADGAGTGAFEELSDEDGDLPF